MNDIINILSQVRIVSRKIKEQRKEKFGNVQKITSAIFLLQFMFRSIAKNLTKEPCKDVVFILMCSMCFIT